MKVFSHPVGINSKKLIKNLHLTTRDFVCETFKLRVGVSPGNKILTLFHDVFCFQVKNNIFNCLLACLILYEGCSKSLWPKHEGEEIQWSFNHHHHHGLHSNRIKLLHDAVVGCRLRHFVEGGFETVEGWSCCSREGQQCMGILQVNIRTSTKKKVSDPFAIFACHP